MAMNKEIEKWERQEGIKFLRRIGLCANQTVLDFGCRVGHYSIPAAKIVGNEGIVYAVDKEQEALNELQQKVKAHNLNNVKIMKTSGQINLDFESESIGLVLLYDVLHYFEKNSRKKLYRESLRVLKQDGLLSVYPKHTLEDNPIRQFEGLNLNDVKREIEDSNFYFEEKYCSIISHDDGLNHGCVLNFRKGEK
jgi:ubiquinone/menaquinone biosynthesis C-methylase UbiE